MTDNRAKEPARARPSGGRISRGECILIVAICALASAVAFTGAGASRPLDSHEAFVARTATEMGRRGDWIVPYLNGAPRLQKPPMEYWLVGAAHALIGSPGWGFITEFEARLPSVLAGIGAVLIAWRLGRTALDDPRVGVVAGAMTATAVGFWTYTRNARPEMVYAFFCGVMMLGFITAMRPDRTRRQRLCAGLIAWGGFCGALLTKGPHLPLMMLTGVALAAAIASPGRRWRAVIQTIQPLTGAVLVAAAVAAWFLPVLHRLPDALTYWGAELFDRAGQGGDLWRNALRLYYLYAAPLLLAPWLVFLPGALLNPWRLGAERRARGLALLLSAVVPAVILSFSQGRRGYYMLPALAPFAVLMAQAAVDLFERARASPRWRSAARGLGVLHAFALIAGAVIAVLAPSWTSGGPFALHIPTALPAALAVAAGAASIMLLRGSRLAESLACLIVGAAAVFVGFGASRAGATTSRFLGAAFARDIARAIQPDRRVVSLIGNLSVINYYADRQIDLIDSDDLPGLLDSDPSLLVLDRASRVDRREITGTVLLRAQPEEPGDDPKVLIADARLAPAQAGGRREE